MLSLPLDFSRIIRRQMTLVDFCTIWESLTDLPVSESSPLFSQLPISFTLSSLPSSISQHVWHLRVRQLPAAEEARGDRAGAAAGTAEDGVQGI